MAATQLKDLHRAATALKNARAIIVTAGMGMSMDSGLPDHKLTSFWKASPKLKEKGMKLATRSNPLWFFNDPEFAWGFYGHRYNLYRNTDPHDGFKIILDWGKAKDYGYFVFTSNIDGHFQKAGFDEKKIVECNGNIFNAQCLDTRVFNETWPMPPESEFEVDLATFRLLSPLPQGPPGLNCTLARPNTLMFDDLDWVSNKTDQQEQQFFHYQMTLQKEGGIPFVVLEVGCGLDVSKVRKTSEDLIGPRNKGTLIRINTQDPRIPNPDRNISLQMSGLEALLKIREIMA